MRVVCDNCGMSYKIPDSKLTKEVNKATCRKCGHAIYIRRPDLASVEAAPAMVPDERTLITTAAAVGMRPPLGPSSFSPGDVAVAEAGHNEATNPRTSSAVAATAYAVLPPAVEINPPEEMLRARQRTQPLPAEPSPEAWAPEVAAPVEEPVPPPFREPSRPRPAVDPTPHVMPSMTTAHDPRGDMTGVLLSALLAAFGVLILVANTLVGSPWVTGIGTFVAFLGCFIAVLLLLTGARGTRPASWLAAMFGGFVLAGGGATLSVLAGSYLDLLTPSALESPVARTATPPEVQVVAPAPAAVPEPVAAPPVVSEPPVTTPPTPTAPPPVVVATPAPTPPTPPAAATTPRPATTTSTTRTETPAPTRTTTPTTTTPTTTTPRTTTPPTTPAPTTTAATSTSSTITPTIIDTIIKSNKNVKGCFITEKNATGAIPSGVKVRFTIQPSGKVTSASVPSGKYAGTDFDSCLSGAMKSLAFPPFTGDPITMSYTFPV